MKTTGKRHPSFGLGYCVNIRAVNDDSLAEPSARPFPVEKLHRERIGR